METPSTLVFEQATVLCYRLFDVAREIDLEKARAVASADVKRLKLSREGSQYLQLPNPPLQIELGARKLSWAGKSVEVHASARVFEHGAVSVLLKVPIEPETTLRALVPLADELYDSREVEALALDLAEQVTHLLSPAMHEMRMWHQNENYTVILVQKLAGDPPVEAILEQADLARLILGETGSRPLSAREQQDALAQQFSYTDNDLAVIDWNAAFVYEPSGSMDIPDLLEIANAQLLELRYFDDVLDTELQQIYAEMAKKRRRWYSVFYSPYRTLARKVSVSVLEISEFIERVDNSLKIIGDFYLARVYEAALGQLRVRPWQESVTRKQGLLTQTYSMLKGEVDTDRSHLLELAIIFLIVFEIIMAAVKVVTE